MKQVSHGVLFLVSDKFLILVRKIETEASKILTFDFLITYYGEDIYEVTTTKYNANIAIKNLWETITELGCNKFGNKQLTEKLTIKILKKWCNIREGVFVNASVSRDEKIKKKP